MKKLRSEKNLQVYVDNFKKFISAMPTENLSKKISEKTGEDKTYVHTTLETYINEQKSALNFLHPFLTCRNTRILEIGAGLCILSLFLKKEGFNITALEPTTGGFDFFSTFQKIIIDYYKEIPLTVLSYPAQELEEKQVGKFDLIFSFNVIEHIPNPFYTLRVLLNIMNEQGKMVHACPNYLIPYDPHFGIPVLATWPGLSSFFFRKKISDNKELWNSLNFITSSRVKKFATQHDLVIKFPRGLLAESYIRLQEDPIFRERQKNIFVMIFSIVIQLPGGLNLLKKLPPTCSTPMQFIISKRSTM